MKTKTANQSKFLGFPFYPFLMGLFPVIYLWSANRAQVHAYVIIPSLLVTLAGLVGLFLATWALTRDRHRAALLAGVFCFTVLSYGQAANLLARLLPWAVLVIAGLLIAAALALIAYFRLGSPPLTRALNLVTAGMVLLQVGSAAPYYLQMAQFSSLAAGINPLTRAGMEDQPQRDVYFIMLDNYGRQDDLLARYNYDNSELVDALKARGFRFPDCAQANYFWTAPAIASILNMEYLDQLGVAESTYLKRNSYGAMAPLIQDSAVLRKFNQYGYHVVTFRGFMGLIDIQNADTYINYEHELPITERLETRSFQSLYWDTTIFPAIAVAAGMDETIVDAFDPEEIEDDPDGEQQNELAPKFRQVYEQNIYAFDALEQIPREVGSPKFVYAHIYSAHWPFMMRPDGSLRLPFTQRMTKAGYIDAVRYTNSRVLDAVDAILENSAVEPVIILQGDHANHWAGNVEWSGTDRVKILSAYYLPGDGGQALYNSISPVNNFRLVFQQYFDEEMRLLPDVNRYLHPQTKQVNRAAPTCISKNLYGSNEAENYRSIYSR